MSLGPPAGKPTTKCIGRVGYDSARANFAMEGKMALAPAKLKNRRRGIFIVRLDALRAWLTREIEVSSPRPVFASSSGCGDWWRFSCHRRQPDFRPPSGTARSLRCRLHEFWGPGSQATKI